jgi:hypothetical protein
VYATATSNAFDAISFEASLINTAEKERRNLMAALAS